MNNIYQSLLIEDKKYLSDAFLKSIVYEKN